MGDYSPIHSGWSSTSTASAAITGGQLVAVSGDDTVAKTAGQDDAWLGVAGFDCGNGDPVTVEHGGVQSLVASGGITAGDQVVSAADGKVASLAVTATPADLADAGVDINAARSIVGTARTTATDGNPVEIQMER